MSADMSVRAAGTSQRAIARMAAVAAMAAAMGIAASATAPVRLVGVSTQGSAVLIEATEPVAYSVTSPDPKTVVIELRNVTVGEARTRIPGRGTVASVELEQATSVDGRALARVRLGLSRPADYKVRSARNIIRVELTASAPLPREPSVPIAAEGEPPLTLEQAIANGAALEPAADPISALVLPVRASDRAAGPTGSPVVLPPTTRAGGPNAAAGSPHSGASSPIPPAARQQPPRPQNPPPATPAAPAPTQTAPVNQIGTGEVQKQYTGHPISMDFQGVDLRAVLRSFAEISGLNMVIDPDVQGTVDIVLTDVPWDQALEVILRGNQLDYTVDGTIVRIARIDTLKREQDARQALAKSAADAGTLAVRTYALSYAKAAQAAPLIKRAALSPRGDVQIDERTNTLIITDLPARLDTAASLIATIDRAEPQVEIEARIITTTREFARAIGVQWGLNGRMTPDIGNTTSLAFPNQGSLGGRLGTQGPGGSDPRAGNLEGAGTVVNLPAIGANTAIGLALGSVNGAFNLDVALSALERTGKGRILSTPRVTTQNNVEAEITQGVEIPVQTVANNTVTVTFKQAALMLKVTPQITAANTVIMQITLENATPGTPVQGIPSIDTQRANTRVQVSDGMTTVMGGIFVSREQSATDRTPVLHRIPLLGWLFKRDTENDESRELLIFITPRILKG